MQVLYPEIQKLKLENLNLLKLWNEGLPRINPFSYPIWNTLPEKEQPTPSVYGANSPDIQMFPPQQIAAP